ncbi:hypothetical protein N7492_002858 [Penicillium capsulatum]|uniref:Peptidase S8/S53 domain-containing protein n=1 Tax=Penicillium capsulatum TaxID=69766 RepID=A0A9W9LVM8_9EURO|nr:hypothetical protein N7492_002858 [Penicillium capsulatum]KAJ6122545.1 hypothetical protein N7512_005010 [Penicillium capsulatum]
MYPVGLALVSKLDGLNNRLSYYSVHELPRRDIYQTQVGEHLDQTAAIAHSLSLAETCEAPAPFTVTVTDSAPSTVTVTETIGVAATSASSASLSSSVSSRYHSTSWTKTGISIASSGTRSPVPVSSVFPSSPFISPSSHPPAPRGSPGAQSQTQDLIQESTTPVMASQETAVPNSQAPSNSVSSVSSSNSAGASGTSAMAFDSTAVSDQTSSDATLDVSSSGSPGVAADPTTVSDEATSTFGQALSESATATSLQSSSPTPTATTMPSSWKGYVDLDGIKHQIPTDDEKIPLMLADGTQITLGKDHLDMNGDTVSYPPDLSSSPKITAGGRTFQMGEGFGDSPGDGTSSGSSGVSNAIGKLGSIVDSGNPVPSALAALEEGVSQISPSAPDELINQVAEGVDSFGDHVKSLLGPMRDLSSSPSTELSELTPDGFRKVATAYPELERGYNHLQSLQKLLKGIKQLRGVAFSKFKDRWVTSLAAGGALTAVAETVKVIHDQKWGTIIAGQTTTSVSPLASRSSSSASTTTTTKSKATSDPMWLIITHDETDLSNFHDMVDRLEKKKVKVDRIVHKNLSWQTAVAWMTKKQAEEIERLDFVRWVIQDTPVKERPSWNSAFSFQSESDGIKKPWDANEQPSFNSTWIRPNHKRANIPWSSTFGHQSFLSTNKRGLPQQPYLTDDSMGNGRTIYVLDSGFTKTHSEFQNRPDWNPDRQVETHVIPNAYTLFGIPPELHAPEDMTDWPYHGTGVAMLAAGNTLGVVPRANLYVVKYFNSYFDAQGRRFDPTPSWVPIKLAFDHVLDRISDANADETVKGSINLPAGYGVELFSFQKMKEVFADMMNKFEEQGMSIVLPAGNQGDEPGVRLGDRLPQFLGTDSNAMITVGGLDEYGYLWSHSTPRDGGRGSITIFLQAANVPIKNLTDHVLSYEGTSFAAPVAAGLATYYMAHPGYRGYLRELTARGLTMGQAVKQLIVRTSFQRKPISRRHLRPGYPLPDHLRAGYNGARGQPESIPSYWGCVGPQVWKRDSTDSVCFEPSLASSLHKSPAGSTLHTSTHKEGSKTESLTTLEPATNQGTLSSAGLGTSSMPIPPLTSSGSPGHPSITAPQSRSGTSAGVPRKTSAGTTTGIACRWSENPRDSVPNSCLCDVGTTETAVAPMSGKSGPDACTYTAIPTSTTTLVSQSSTSTISMPTPYVSTDDAARITSCASATPSIYSSMEVVRTMTFCAGDEYVTQANVTVISLVSVKRHSAKVGTTTYDYYWVAMNPGRDSKTGTAKEPDWCGDGLEWKLHEDGSIPNLEKADLPSSLRQGSQDIPTFPGNCEYRGSPGKAGTWTCSKNNGVHGCHEIDEDVSWAKEHNCNGGHTRLVPRLECHWPATDLPPVSQT